MMEASTINAFIGGAIIGLSATIMLAFNGKITGISGILAGVLTRPKREILWRYSFVIGLLMGGVIMLKLNPSLFQYEIKFSFLEAIIAGLIVGFGTRLGSGCTSGHGVCGLPRLSMRSLIAVLTFMGTAVITVAIKGLL